MLLPVTPETTRRGFHHHHQMGHILSTLLHCRHPLRRRPPALLLCRELQRQNKSVMDDSKRIAREEHNKRQELSDKFHATIQDVTVKLDSQSEERLGQIKENESLREKLQNFLKQYV